MSKQSITNFVNEIPVKKEKRGTITLYNLIKKNCPDTISAINIKLNGHKKYLKHKNDWYIICINYLTKNGIFQTEKTDVGTFHNVTENYLDYFKIPKSTVFSETNFPQHLILFKDTSQEFLKKTNLIDKEGNEYFAEKKEDKDFKISQKKEKIIKIAANFLMIWSILQFGIMISKYGYQEILPMILNSILFAISLLLIVKDKK